MGNKSRKNVKSDDDCKVHDPQVRKWIREMECCFNYDTLFTTEEEKEAYKDLKYLYMNLIAYLTTDAILKQKGMSKGAIEHTLSTCYTEEETMMSPESPCWDALDKLVQYGKVKPGTFPYFNFVTFCELGKNFKTKVQNPELRKYIRELQSCFNYDSLFTTEEEKISYEELTYIYLNKIAYFQQYDILQQKGMSEETIKYTLSMYNAEEDLIHADPQCWEALDKLVQYGKIKTGTLPYNHWILYWKTRKYLKTIFSIMNYKF